MTQFRKKPVVIEAVRVVTVLIAVMSVEWGDLPDWLKEAYARDEWTFNADGITIRTLEGEMRAEKGDWIIRGVQGELYPCKPDIFAATYETAAPSALADIAAERQRQIDAEGWTVEHDDEHSDGSLALAAACYAEGPSGRSRVAKITGDVSGGRGDTPVWGVRKVLVPVMWPQTWCPSWWKPKDRRQDLVRAGALIVAEIERLDRRAKP